MSTILRDKNETISIQSNNFLKLGMSIKSSSDDDDQRVCDSSHQVYERGGDELSHGENDNENRSRYYPRVLSSEKSQTIISSSQNRGIFRSYIV